MPDEPPVSQEDDAKRTPTLDYAPPPDPLMKRTYRWFVNARPATWWEWLLVCVIIVALIAVLLPAMDGGDRLGKGVACMSQLRNIAVMLNQYARQNNDVYPLQLTDAWTPGVDPKIFVCPDSKTETQAAVGATPQQTLANLAGKNHVTYVYVVGGMARSAVTPKMIVAYEPVLNHPRSKGARASVLFGDGHVSTVTAANLAQMIKELNAGKNPPPVLSPSP